MNKHTPGPWLLRTVPTSAGLCHIVSAAYWRGAFIYGDGLRKGVDDSLPKAQELAANARLIAAAPDLLEACETFAEWLGREESGFARAGNKRDAPEGERAWRDWYNENLRLCALAQEQARAAIAKATGEQP